MIFSEDFRVRTISYERDFEIIIKMQTSITNDHRGGLRVKIIHLKLSRVVLENISREWILRSKCLFEAQVLKSKIMKNLKVYH